MAHSYLALVPSDGAVDEAVPESFDDLFRRYASYVGAIGIRLLGRPEEVDDLVQEVFLDAFRAVHKLQGGAASKRWLSVVAVRHARRRLRARRLRWWVGLDGSSDYEGIASSGTTPHDQAMLAELFAALDRLPVRQRLVWSLRHLQGEELLDIATLCGCSLATVKRELMAAHASIREKLHDG